MASGQPGTLQSFPAMWSSASLVLPDLILILLPQVRDSKTPLLRYGGAPSSSKRLWWRDIVERANHDLPLDRLVPLPMEAISLRKRMALPHATPQAAGKGNVVSSAACQ